MATLLQTCLLLGVFVPLASFVFLAFFGTKLGGGYHVGLRDHGETDGHHAGPVKGEPLAGWVATAAIGFSLVMAIIALVVWRGHPESHAEWSRQVTEGALVWTNIGSVPVHFGIKLDSLTVIMFLMVSLCSTCIHVFSVGYMKGDPRFPRFFTFLSLFCFSMLGLVISSNLVFLFVFWELVGVCSYFLIGFWFEKKSASDAGIKAFVVNRVGDFGFMVGLGLCFIYLGNMSLDGAAATFEAGAHAAGAAHGELSAAAEAVQPQTAASASRLFSTMFYGVPLATWMGICLFCGAIGKSAQFPLQVWLPDAMEGPTPVSALIHAATMVAAGVYLVARIFLLLTPGAQLFIAVIGCITLTMAALIAIVQLDIKRVLAYSTLSQLGYMIFAMGVGAWIAALFHLLTHAFFKALLFLGSGQVIVGCHHEQDLRRMGGLWSKMPNTAVTFLIAVLAISGVGIPWTQVGIGGFYSKDEILVVAHHRAFAWSTSGEAEHVTPQGATGSLLPVPNASAEAEQHGRTSRPWHPTSGPQDASSVSIIPVSYQHEPSGQGATGSLLPVPSASAAVEQHGRTSRGWHPTSGSQDASSVNIIPVSYQHEPSGQGATGSLLPVANASAEAEQHGRTSRPWHPTSGSQDASSVSIIPVSYQHELSGQPARERPGHTPAQAGAAPGEDHGTNYAGQYPNVNRLPFLLFFLPILVAYITPFYMGRCFVLTFLSKPRDQQVHEHAHETKLMYGPLLVLAAMVFISGWFVFRPLVAQAVPAGGPLVPAIDGHDHAMHGAHQVLPFWVGLSWIVGLVSAYLIYRNGFAVAERLRRLPLLRPAYAVLWNKFYFDHVYNFLLVGGTKVVAVICRLFDDWIVDGIVNNSARLTERISRFSGVVLDNMGVDGLVNLVGRIGWDLGGLLRAVQTGIIRNYVLLAVIGVSGVVICILSDWNVAWALAWVIVAVAALLLPWSGLRRLLTGER